MSRLALLFLAFALFATGLGRDRFEAWIVATELPSLGVETSVEMLDRNGALLRAFTVGDGRWRLSTTLAAVDPGYIEMLISYEDKRFFRHAGVDPLAMVRAFGQALWYRKIVSGGSTLTMQVARLLEDGSTGKWRAKLRQIRVALALERRLSKDAILTLYLNRAPFGGNLEGVRAASLAYFGKEPRRLTTAEAALLVALPQSPEGRRPDRFTGSAHAARERVLARVETYGLIDAETARTAATEVVPHDRRLFPSLAAHLTDRIRAENPAGQVHSLTLDAGFQSQLEDLAERAARDAGKRLSIAILVADHRRGEILASVGSAGYELGAREGFVDMTRAVRSPGSTLKPLVYGLAFDQGLAHPETLIEDRPVAFGTYAPQNFDGRFRGTVRVRDALQISLNVPVVKLTEALGPARLLAHMRRAGTEVRLPGGGVPGLAVALGGVGVSLEGLVRLYASLANGGHSVDVHSLAGARAEGPPQAVVSPEAAWMVGDILSGIAPPRGAARTGLAYKTGTSYGHRDAWAIGFDGAHVAGVWMGRPDGTPVPGAFGGELAAPVLFEAFALLKPELDRLPPPPPGTLIVGHAGLPQPLKKFRSREAAFEETGGPEVAFPPDGARVEVSGAGLAVKVRDGRPPFTWLADGRPVLMRSHERAALLELGGPGFVTLSVIDSEGRAARSRVRLD